MKIQINTSLKHLNINEIRKISRLIISWCLNHLGENKRIHKPLKIDLNKEIVDKNFCAEYEIDEENRVIRLYLKSIKNIKELISGITHEYAHDIQPITTKYDKLYRKYGYVNHPQEKQARKIEERFTKICFDDIKPKIQKIVDKSKNKQ